jgi:phosphatidylglycerophosphatase A
MSNKPRIVFTRDEMLQMNIKSLNERGVTVEDIATVTYNQQSRYTKDIDFKTCIESVEKLLSLRDVFHYLTIINCH